MDIINKDIIMDIKKVCTICGNENKNKGIEIMGSFICEECVQMINLVDVNDIKYEIIKNKIKKSITSKILYLDEL